MVKSNIKKEQSKNRGQKMYGVVNYSLGDFLIKVKNAGMAKKHKVVVKSTKLIEEMAKLLKKEGYLAEVSKEGNILTLSLSYVKKEPFLTNIKLVSRPGLRVYKSSLELKKFKSPARLIVSTSLGLMTSINAIKKNVGGEVLAEII